MPTILFQKEPQKGANQNFTEDRSCEQDNACGTEYDLHQQSLSFKRMYVF